MRESKAQEEDEWLQKQSMARKKHKEIELDLLPHEREEGFLEEKGIKLYKNGEFEGAINAYDIAIQMFPAKARYVRHVFCKIYSILLNFPGSGEFFRVANI